MAEKSLISWTHGTWNPWVGCHKIAPECTHCYIGREIRKQVDWQMGDGSLRKPWSSVYLTKTWNDPYNWQNEINLYDMLIRRLPSNEPLGKCRRVFTCSLSDFFLADVDKLTVANPHITDDGKRQTSDWGRTLRQHQRVWRRMGTNVCCPTWRQAAWQVIKDTPNLIYLILTKRPELIPARLPKDWGDGYPNVWLGTSVGCRLTLSKLDSLRKVPVHPKAVRFLSCEPLLESIAWDIDLSGIGWVIVGGESGTNPEYRWNPQGDWRRELQGDRGRRTMAVGWAKDLRMKCEAQNIPVWFKQITGAKSGMGEDALGEVVHEVPPPPYGQWAPMEDSKLVVLA